MGAIIKEIRLNLVNSLANFTLIYLSIILVELIAILAGFDLGNLL